MGERHYELIELKVASDTPLYAAVELLGYASVWLLARQTPPEHAPKLLTANCLGPRVLAPATFYAPFHLRGLERSIDDGVKRLGDSSSVELSFAFDVLPDSIVDSPASNSLILDELTRRRPLHA